MNSSPCAKFTIWVALKIMAMPTASKAYRQPLTNPLTTSCRKNVIPRLPRRPPVPAHRFGSPISARPHGSPAKSDRAAPAPPAEAIAREDPARLMRRARARVELAWVLHLAALVGHDLRPGGAEMARRAERDRR